ncbi:MAG: diguanylate cyclase [Aquificae bacterium]|nr:diguanylate cyclase [Aquificota bacterium]
MENKIIDCQLYKKLLNNEKLSTEDIKTLMNIVRKEINFLIRNNIILSPMNYERWFRIFCYLHEKGKELTDLEILGLYKDLFFKDSSTISYLPIEERPIGFVEKLKKVADTIDEKLKEIIESINNHQKEIDQHSSVIEENKEKIKENEEITKALNQILKELEELKQQNKTLKEELHRYHQDIEKLKEELNQAKTEANIDFLTTLYNRRRFERALLDMLKDYKERKYPFSIILLDIDDFKTINDKYGHPVGDLVLKEVANILKNYLRANSVSARIGGEEFGILLPGVEIKDAVKIAERLKHIIENRHIKTDGTFIKFTASFGITQAKEGDTLNSIIERADKALYKSKQTGKNRISVEL